MRKGFPDILMMKPSLFYMVRGSTAAIVRAGVDIVCYWASRYEEFLAAK